MAEESFGVAADESKVITFIVETVFLSEVNAIPQYRAGTAEISFATLEYTLNNLDRRVDDVRVVLSVSKDTAPLEESTVLTLDALDVGSTGGSHNYIPAAGWREGLYRFRIDLYIGGSLYTTSLDAELLVDPIIPPSPTPSVTPTTPPATPTPVLEATPTSVPISTPAPVPTATSSPAPAVTPAPSLPAVVAVSDLADKVSESGLVLSQPNCWQDRDGEA